MFLESAWVLIPVLVLGIYGLVLLKFVAAFKKEDEGEYHEISGLSIVLPIRNEAASIDAFFSRLSACEMDGIDLEVIVINDHSTDYGPNTLRNLEFPFKLKTIDAPKGVSGKKRCARLGVELAIYPWILTLDIDAEIPRSFFQNLNCLVLANVRYAIVPLKPKKQNSLVRYFFDLEFISLHFTGMASAKMKKPLLSNAACSLIQKDAFLETVSTRRDWSNPSGDDVFAMFAIADKFGDNAIGVAAAQTLKVEVDFPVKLSYLWRQRLRWAGKSNKIKNPWFTFVSLLVVGFNLILANSLYQLFCFGFSTNHFVFLFAAALIQFFFLTYVCNAVERRDLIKWIVPLTLVYPFYLIAIVIAQFFCEPKWK